MKILKVIHGFPPDYMAGSEVYSYHLVKELINQNIETFVFTRVENEFDDNYTIYNEKFENINIQRVNKPKRDYLYEDKFYDNKMDEIFKEYLASVEPDIVHFGHLSHLSTNLIKIVKEFNIPIVYTIHDFWLFCVKGQMINQNGTICENPSIENCTQCSNYVVSAKQVENSVKHMKEVIDLIDIFISPSHYLKDFFISQGINQDKIKYLKYGFNTKKIIYKKKVFTKSSKINFGFMGRVIPTKGIQVLVDTFKKLPNEQLSIYGNIGIQKRYLETKNIIFKGAYDNNDINEVLKDIDVLIVPSIWYENAPLVIQEAFLAGIPVITSDIGGMAEFVKNKINGFTFKVGSSNELMILIENISNNPIILNNLNSNRNMVIDIEDDAKEIIKIYDKLIMIKPWRITIDTNPDQCNLNCIMCDTHSIYNDNSKPNRKFMDENLLKKSIDEAIKLGVKEIIPTTMGEPLLYKYFDTFIDKLSKSNVKLNLTTNGTFPNFGVEKWADKLLPILSDIKISINSIDSQVNESIMINDDTQKKLEDINTFINLRDTLYPSVTVTLQVTFLKSNLNDLENIIKFAIENNIDRVKGHQLWITYDEIEDESLQNTTEKINEWNNFISLIDKYRDTVKLVNFEKLKLRNNTNFMPSSYTCPFLGKELWIDYNGDFNICCAPSDKRKTLGSWGNVKNTKITDMFNSTKYKNLIDSYKNETICKICSLRKI